VLRLEAISVASGAGAGEPRLAEMSLTVHPGDVLAVLGPNGAGKSTLVGALAGSLAPSHGRVTLDGQPLASFGLAELARRRAVLSQDNTLAFGFAVDEVIALGRGPHAGCGREADRAAIEAAMRLADATILSGRRYTALSGGERQRVQLARTLAQLDVASNMRRGPPGYLLLDEPTAALDLAHQHATLQLAVSLSREQGVGVLAVLHDANLAALYADRIAIVRRGRLVDQGTPLQVLTEAMFERVFGLRVDTPRHPHHADRPMIIASRPEPMPAPGGEYARTGLRTQSSESSPPACDWQ